MESRTDPQPEPWFVAAFRREYLDVYAHRDERDAARAAAFCAGVTGAEGVDWTLDLCCGAGRHLLQFEAMGMECVGLDLSSDLLKHARASGVRSPLVEGDSRSLPFRDQEFGRVVNLFSSFGYFESESEDVRMLSEVFRVLAPGGAAIFDLMNPDAVRSSLVPDSEEVRPPYRIRSRRRIDESRCRVEKSVEIFDTATGEEIRAYTESVRLYMAAEFDVLLTRVGFAIERRCGDYDGSNYDPASSPRQVVVARRPISIQGHRG